MVKELKKQERPRETDGTITKIKTGCGSIYITVGKNKDNKPIEVFATLGKSGGCAMAQLEALGRSISLGLKYGIPLEEYIDQFDNIRCSSFSTIFAILQNFAKSRFFFAERNLYLLKKGITFSRIELKLLTS